MKALKGTVRECDYAPGSIKRLRVGRVSNLDFIPFTQGGTIFEDQIIPDDSNLWKDYYFQVDTLLLETIPERDQSGTLYRHRIEGTHPGLQAPGVEEIANLQDGHYILQVYLYSGPRFLVGNKERPCVFQSSQQSGAARTNPASSSWVFEALSLFPLTQIVIPEDPCRNIRPSDFQTEVEYNLSYEIISLSLFTTNSNITQVTNYPSATLLDTAGNVVATLTWDNFLQAYTPNTTVSVTQRLTMQVQGLEFDHRAGISCSIDFTKTIFLAGLVVLASFTFNAPSTQVSFADTSIYPNPPSAWLWDFGDGNTSTLQNPTHTYTQIGVYTVTMTITVNGTEYTATNQVDITQVGVPTVQLSSDVSSGDEPLTVNFTALGLNFPSPVTSYSLDPGDGSSIVTQASPNFSHTYANPGTWLAKVTATDGTLTVSSPALSILVQGVVSPANGAFSSAFSPAYD